MTWLSETHDAWPRPTNDGVDWLKNDAATGEAVPLFDAQKMRAAFAALPGLGAEDVERVPTGGDPRDRRRRAMGRLVEVLGARISHRERELDAKGSVLAAAKTCTACRCSFMA